MLLISKKKRKAGDGKGSSPAETGEEMTVTTENREHKSDVFSMLMEYPEYALDVYNALNGTSYEDPDLVEIKTLEKGISLSIRNDAAFIIGADVSIYEHQSKYSKNMPLRSLIYFAEIVKSYIKERNLDIYGRRLVSIPRPQFVVFYNGTEIRPEVEIQRLSDAYEHDEEISLELKCIVYNINPNNNDKLKKESYVLEGYATFVEKVREVARHDAMHAVEIAIEYCKSNNILKEFFIARKGEVLKNMTLDMTFEARESMIRRDAREEGREEGEMKLAALISKLIMLGRDEDVKRAVSDEKIRGMLYKEFGMIDD